MGFEGVKEKIPLLIALPQLDALGTILDLPRRIAHFLTLRRYSVPLHDLPKGHLGIRLDDFNGDEGSDEPPDYLRSLFMSTPTTARQKRAVQSFVAEWSVGAGRTRIMDRTTARRHEEAVVMYEDIHYALKKI